jgi:hypothetical protein
MSVNGTKDVALLNTRTAATTMVRLKRGDVSGVRWSPSGRYLVLHVLGSGDWAYDPVTEREWQLSTGAVTFASAENDDYLAVVRDPASQRLHLRLTAIEAGEYRVLASGAEGGKYLSWQVIGPDLVDFWPNGGEAEGVSIDVRSGRQLSRVDGRRLSAERQGLAYALWRDGAAGVVDSLWGCRGVYLLSIASTVPSRCFADANGYAWAPGMDRLVISQAIPPTARGEFLVGFAVRLVDFKTGSERVLFNVPYNVCGFHRFRWNEAGDRITMWWDSGDGDC